MLDCEAGENDGTMLWGVETRAAFTARAVRAWQGPFHLVLAWTKRPGEKDWRAAAGASNWRRQSKRAKLDAQRGRR
jgi:hypothetical protein